MASASACASALKVPASAGGGASRQAPGNAARAHPASSVSARRGMLVTAQAVAGGPKTPENKSSAASRSANLVVRVEDPLAGRPYRPAMPGDDPDFWEGSSWDLVGFVSEYLWAFGIVLAIFASIYAVTSYSADEPAPAPATVPQEQATPAPESPAFEAEDEAPPL